MKHDRQITQADLDAIDHDLYELYREEVTRPPLTLDALAIVVGGALGLWFVLFIMLLQVAEVL